MYISCFCLQHNLETPSLRSSTNSDNILPYQGHKYIRHHYHIHNPQPCNARLPSSTSPHYPRDAQTTATARSSPRGRQSAKRQRRRQHCLIHLQTKIQAKPQTTPRQTATRIHLPGTAITNNRPQHRYGLQPSKCLATTII